MNVEICSTCSKCHNNIDTLLPPNTPIAFLQDNLHISIFLGHIITTDPITTMSYITITVKHKLAARVGMYRLPCHLVVLGLCAVRVALVNMTMGVLTPI